MLRRLVPLAATAVVTLAVGAESAFACSCVGKPPGVSNRDWAVQRFEEADGAAVMRLKSVEPTGNRRRADFTYRVLNVYKDEIGLPREGKLYTVRNNLDSAACGLPTETGQRYGLYFSRFRGKVLTGLCSLESPRRMRRAAELSAQSESLAATPSGESAPCPHRR